MHEFGLVEGIIDAVVERAGDRRVRRITVGIGTLHRVADGSIERAFESARTGTILADATLELIQMPVTSTCRDCRWARSGEGMVLLCPGCGGTAMVYMGGDELVLESIEYQDAAPIAEPALGRGAG